MDVRKQDGAENAELNEFQGCLPHDLRDLASRSSLVARDGTAGKVPL